MLVSVSASWNASLNSRRSSSTGDHTSRPRRLSPPGAINKSIAAVAIYIGFVDGRLAVAKCLKSKVWNKGPRKSTLIFVDTLISVKHVQCSMIPSKFVHKKV